MGCFGSTRRRAQEEEQRTCGCESPHFAGLSIPASKRCEYGAILARMDAQNLPYLSARCLLTGFNERGTWDVYLLFPEWPGPVTRACVENLMKQYRACAREWLSKLRGYDGFTRGTLRVRLFGIVLGPGVTTDASFDRAYGAYPVVRNWTERGEASPWILEANVPPTNFYLAALDLHTIRVAGNRRGTSATFHPTAWDGYVHPEGCAGFQTRLWLGTRAWNATAQRHYLRVSGVLADPLRGDFGDNLYVLKHEMGHCFFLDDLYDARKYPSPLPNAACPCAADGRCRLAAEDTIMHGGREITAFDHAQLRHVWSHCRSRSSTTLG